MMKYTVVLEKDEDGIYVTTVPALPGCISDGKTVEEALTNIREAIQGFIDWFFSQYWTDFNEIY